MKKRRKHHRVAVAGADGAARAAEPEQDADDSAPLIDPDEALFQLCWGDWIVQHHRTLSPEARLFMRIVLSGIFHRMQAFRLRDVARWMGRKPADVHILVREVRLAGVVRFAGEVDASPLEHHAFALEVVREPWRSALERQTLILVDDTDDPRQLRLRW